MAATVYEYFQQALRRAPMEVPSGPVVAGADGTMAVFQVTLRDGRISYASFRATTCVTLLALCEHLSHLVSGLLINDALELTPGCLLAFHPDVPPARHNRAELAIRALHHALKGNS